MIPVMLIISICIFGIIKLTPGDPVGANLNPKSTAEQKAAERHRLGLDRPIPEQYVRWLGRTVQGDFGESITYKKPVGAVIGTFIWNTFLLNIIDFIIAFVISIPLGIMCATRKYSRFDNFWTVFSLLGISMPSFFFGLLLIYLFSVKLGWLPVSGMVEAGTQNTGIAYWGEVAVHMVLPGLVLITGSLAGLLRYTRNGMLEVLGQDYIRTARSKGLNEKVVVYKHALRNALIPIVTLIGFYIPGLFSGAVILETIFRWPGLGLVMIESISARDYNLMMTMLIFLAFLTLLGNLFQDIGYALVDPRVKVE